MIFQRKNNQGLTLVEVLIALAIFTISFMAIIDSQNMSVKNSAVSKRMTIAMILTQEKMAERLLKYKGMPLSEIPEKEEGEFEEEYSKYRWEETVRDFHYDLSFLAEMLQPQDKKEKDEVSPESPLQQAIPKLSSFIKNSVKELTVTVYWKEGGHEQKTSMTTHLVHFQTPIEI